MHFLVDIGNSRVKWGVEANGVSTLLGNELRPSNNIQALFDRCWSPILAPKKVLISNVAGIGVAVAVTEWVKQHWQCDATLLIPPASGWGVTNGYTEPKRLGADRWAKLVAVRSYFAGYAFVVDFGTAVTMDVLDDTGLHHGGLIVPGVDAMHKALASSTQGVRVRDKTKLRGHYGLLARDTSGAVVGGTTYALVATVERVAADVEATLGISMRRIVTGGDGLRMMPLLSSEFEYVAELVLNGLAVMVSRSP